MMGEPITNSEKYIDSRDVIARIAELEDERSDLTDLAENANNEDELKDAEEAIKQWEEDYGGELQTLRELAEEGEQYSADWKHGASLIREDEFVTYAEEFAGDIGAIDPKANWPLNHIDWEAAAEELKQDYTEVEFDGETYLVR